MTKETQNSDIINRLTAIRDELNALLAESRELTPQEVEMMSHIHSIYKQLMHPEKNLYKMLNEFVNQKKEPERHAQIARLIGLSEKDRAIELQKIFAKIPPFDIHVDCSACNFLDTHWGIWIKMGWVDDTTIKTLPEGNTFTTIVVG